MATFDTVKSKMESLISKANRTTRKRDTTLTGAVGSLIDGFGKADGEIIHTVADSRKSEMRYAASQLSSIITTTATASVAE